MEEYDLIIERIDLWLDRNKSGIESRIDDFRNFLYNFVASYPRLDENTLQQLAFDLRPQEHEFWTMAEKDALTEAVFRAYGENPLTLEFNIRKENAMMN